jgi:hypothetical protein
MEAAKTLKPVDPVDHSDSNAEEASFDAYIQKKLERSKEFLSLHSLGVSTRVMMNWLIQEAGKNSITLSK